MVFPVFQKRSLYHSDLREKTEAAPLRVCFTSPPRDSRFAGKPAYCTLEIEGDGIDYTYAVENDAIRAQLSAVEFGTWYNVRALGSKDAAFLEITEADAPKVENRITAVEAAPVEEPAAKPRQESPEAVSLTRGYWDALDAAVTIVAAFRERYHREPSEAERTIATSLWIEQNRTNCRRPLSSERG